MDNMTKKQSSRLMDLLYNLSNISKVTSVELELWDTDGSKTNMRIYLNTAHHFSILKIGAEMKGDNFEALQINSTDVSLDLNIPLRKQIDVLYLLDNLPKKFKVTRKQLRDLEDEIKQSGMKIELRVDEN